MSSEMAIHIEKLSKHYHHYEKHFQHLLKMLTDRRKQYFNAHPVLKDINFQIKNSETVDIIGRSGSGRPTSLQLICGLLNPSGDSIKPHGRIDDCLSTHAPELGRLTGQMEHSQQPDTSSIAETQGSRETASSTKI
ncbi:MULTISPECIES: ATP-binding cassette domain-containing protein [unclassified Pseudomonas]|uniref:ATP-binding cassette domain-containing protein n=1 Tax=unclassified Pseudomonas TaxID=196821 RepID=UPI00200D7C3A|nr:MULTISPECIES: ATP-binding cassette domain-containing protein [unclassified Pseudomonas]